MDVALLSSFCSLVLGVGVGLHFGSKLMWAGLTRKCSPETVAAVRTELHRVEP